MAIVRVQRIQNPKSNLVRDQVVNTFHFDTGPNTADPPGTALQTITDGLDNLFNQKWPADTGLSIRDGMAETTMAAQRVTYKAYNLDQPKPRAPLAVAAAANPTPATGGVGYPSEVALCLSFRAAQDSGVNMKRRRGRIYIGPLLPTMSQETSGGQPMPTTAYTDAVVGAANRFFDFLALADIFWGIYSPQSRFAAGGGTGPYGGGDFEGGAARTGFFRIHTVWVDNAYDTQRRRGRAPSARAQTVV